MRMYSMWVRSLVSFSIQMPCKKFSKACIFAIKTKNKNSHCMHRQTAIIWCNASRASPNVLILCYLMWETLAAGNVSRKRRGWRARIPEERGPELLCAADPRLSALGHAANYSPCLLCQCSVAGKGAARWDCASQGLFNSFSTRGKQNLRELFQGYRGRGDEMTDTQNPNNIWGFIAFTHSFPFTADIFYTLEYFTTYYITIICLLCNLSYIVLYLTILLLIC